MKIQVRKMNCGSFSAEIRVHCSWTRYISSRCPPRPIRSNADGKGGRAAPDVVLRGAAGSEARAFADHVRNAWVRHHNVLAFEREADRIAELHARSAR